MSQESTGRTGGWQAWSPRITPPIGVDLSDEQKLACAFRVLAREGFAENLAGHITWQRPGESTMLVNPWGLWWREISAGDICEVGPDASFVSGRWDVTPAIHIHTELHRRRPDARVVVHNHPYHVSVLAAVGVLPEIVHQTGSMFDGEIRFVEEYTGEVDDAELGEELALMIGDSSVVILASHGIIVTAPTIEEATYKSASIDRVCRMTLDVMRLGREAKPLPPPTVMGMKASLIERGSTVYFAGAVRQLIQSEPDVLL